MKKKSLELKKELIANLSKTEQENAKGGATVMTYCNEGCYIIPSGGFHGHLLCSVGMTCVEYSCDDYCLSYDVECWGD